MMLLGTEAPCTIVYILINEFIACVCVCNCIFGMVTCPSHDTTTMCRACFMAKTIMVDGITYRFQIWDTAGQERVCFVTV